MLPILISIGPFVLRTLTLMSFLAFFVAAFLFWRKCKEEHYDEAEIFDGFLVSSLVGALGARIAFIIFNFNDFGFNVGKWLNVFSNPGFNIIVGLIVAGLAIYRFAQKHKWDVFEITDFWVTAVSSGLAILWLGIFFDGTGFGYATKLPWGIIFPGVFEKHQPVQIYFFILFAALAAFLSWAEYNYRTFIWYRAGKNTAQTGFLTSVFIACAGLFSLVMAFVRPAQLVLVGIPLDIPLYVFLLVFGVILLIHRSGRSILPGGNRKTGVAKNVSF